MACLCSSPVVLLLDEPVAGMTEEERLRTGELVTTIADEGTTVLVIEHDMDFVRRFAHKVTVMHEGKILTEGTVAEVQQNETVCVRSTSGGGGRGHRWAPTDTTVEGQVASDDGARGARRWLLRAAGRTVSARRRCWRADGVAAIPPARSASAARPSRPRRRKRARRRHGYVPQGRELFLELTVSENLRIGETTGEAVPAPARSSRAPTGNSRCSSRWSRRRHPHRRPAAAVGDRAGAGDEAEARARRADRGIECRSSRRSKP